ncbi:MAG: hypothetical protein K2X93_21290, partial [Candidatus Obscuribacterales bacterium]|nr:hypothetical protein [Candidatus Obscuribacterales bacterium]
NREVTDLWDELDRMLPELDHIVVYVGANGSEEAIRRAAVMPPEKVTFVLCDCNLREKERVICTSGMSTARTVMCECGGRHTMRALFERYIKSGTVG